MGCVDQIATMKPRTGARWDITPRDAGWELGVKTRAWEAVLFTTWDLRWLLARIPANISHLITRPVPTTRLAATLAILPQIPARMGTIAVPILILACITLPALVAASSKIANGPLKKPATSGLVMTAAGMAILVRTWLLVAAPVQDRVSLSREGSRRRRRRWRRWREP